MMTKKKSSIKRMAEGGEAKKGLNDTKFGLGLLSPAYAISQMASGNAGIGDFGVMGLMDSEMIISGTSGTVNSISVVGTYSLSFNFIDLAGNNLNGVNVSMNIII